MGRHLFKRFISRLYYSITLRIFISISLLLCAAYYALMLPWANRAVSEYYLQHTGHELQHDQIDVHLFACRVRLAHLKDSAQLWQADEVIIDMACLQSVRDQSLVINSINIRKLHVTAHQLENSQWNFNDVLLHQQKRHKENTKNSAKHPIPISIKNIHVIDSSIRSNLKALSNLSLDADHLNFTLSNLDWRSHQKSIFSLKADLNKTAQLKVSGELNVASLSAELDMNAHRIPLVWFNSVLKPYAAVDVLSGTFELHNHISVVSGKLQQLTSSGKLNSLQVRPIAMEQDAVKWKYLEWNNAKISLMEKSIHVPLATLDGLDGQFIVDKNRKTNLQAIFVKASEKPSSLESSPGSNHALSTADEKKWQFAVDRLVINKAAIGFYDQSLTPSFTVIVQDFSGDVVNISSDEKVFASINMAGNVDGYSPVTLKGTSNLLSKTPKLDVLLSFKHLDMGALSPYSAEYAGWHINKGLLSADLNYHYENGKILGKNHVVIDHLEFGAKVRGTHVVDIPLRLGLALLTDQNGVAVLDTEISGAPSDPQFNMKEIFFRALGNTLKKIVMSPFKFIANLLNTKEDLGRIQFTPGESQLSDTAKEKLQLLNQAMKKRPKMRLAVQGIYDTSTDLLALKEEQVKSSMQKAGLTNEALVTRNEAWNIAVNNRYKISGLPNISASIENKYKEMIAAENVDPERLKKLAHERAQAVKQYFVLQLAVPGENILLNSDVRCGEGVNCSASEVIFTLEV